jgi:uncharacterized protein YqjF (DUF2071 family)
MHALLAETAHRPWPLAHRRWVMIQRWHDLLFAHWPLDPAALRPLVPRELELDLFDGRAWIGIVPFRMSGVRLHGLPPLPRAHAFAELNVRTYVVRDDKPGVWFASLDAGSALIVTAARAWFHLPYFRARMVLEERDGWIEYRSQRTQRGAPRADLDLRYRPTGPAERSRAGTLERFLTERYCLYARGPGGELLRGDIHHAPWPLQPAEARIAQNDMASAVGVELPAEAPLVHFTRFLEVLLWAPTRVA